MSQTCVFPSTLALKSRKKPRHLCDQPLPAMYRTEKKPNFCGWQLIFPVTASSVSWSWAELIIPQWTKSPAISTPPSSRASPDSWKAVENSDPGVIPLHHSIRVEQQPVSAVWRTRLNLLGIFFPSKRRPRIPQPSGAAAGLLPERGGRAGCDWKKGRF